MSKGGKGAQQKVNTKDGEPEYVKLPLEHEDMWPKLKAATSCSSLLKKHLHKDNKDNRYDELKNIKTDLGGDLGDCIQSGKLFR